jgi:hypothetical protein
MNLNKPKILILSLLLSGSCEMMYSQGDTLVKRDSCLNNILETKVLRKGIYKDIKEFQTNSPFFACNLSTYKHDRSAEYYLKTDGNVLVLVDSTGKERRIPEAVCWGFSDGTKVYYIDHRSIINEMLIMGHFCIYSKALFGANVGYNPWNSGWSGGSNATLPEYILNILTGQIMDLTVKNLKTFVLSDDPELLEQFNSENMQASVMDLYVKKYNKRHPVSF